MTVKELVERLDLEVVCLPDPDREITGGYCGDLLSWVMGRASAGDVWITIMSNMNIVAVASLADPACILLSEGVRPDDGVCDKALAQGVNILSTKLDSFAASVSIASLL